MSLDDQLVQELRTLLLEAARGAKDDPQGIAAQISARVVADLATKWPDGKVSAGGNMPVLLTPEQMGELKGALSSPRGGGGSGSSSGGSFAGDNSSFWNNAKKVALASLAGALLLTLISTIVLIWSLTRGDGAVETSAAQDAVAAPVLTGSALRWSNVEHRIDFSADLPRSVACGTVEPGDQCDTWPEVQGNLRERFRSDPAYVVKMAQEVARVGACDVEIPAVSPELEVGTLLEIMDDCLSQDSSSGN